MDGARPAEAHTAPRGRLAVLLVVALALPVLIVVLGSRAEAPSFVEMASAAPTRVEAPTTEAPPTTEAETTTTEAETTTSAETSTTAWSSSTTPTTVWSSSTTPTTSWSTSTAGQSSSTTGRSATKVAPVAAAPTTAAPTVYQAPATVYQAPPTTKAASTSAAAFLACVRQRESGGNYSINTNNGYYGAYQFHPATWNTAARMAGRPDLVGLLPHLASPADQDAVALALYNSPGGAAHWGGACT